MTVHENENLTHVLIFDKRGFLGPKLANQLSKKYLCVLVSGQHQERDKNILPVLLKRNIPRIPNSNYSYYFIVYDKKISGLISSFVKKATEDGAEIFILVPVRKVEEDLIKSITGISAKVTVVVIGDMFAGEVDWDNPAMEIIRAGKTGAIVLENNGLSLIYPIKEQDVIEALVSLADSPQKKMSVVALLPSHPITALSFAGMLYKKEPSLKIDILVGDKKKKVEKHYSYTSYFGPNYFIYDKLPEVVIEKASEHSPRNRKKQVKKVKLSFPKIRYPIVVGLFIILILFPFISAFLGISFLYRAKTLATSGDLEKARTSVEASREFFLLADKTALGLRLLDSMGVAQAKNMLVQYQDGKEIGDMAITGIDGVRSLRNVLLQKSLDPEREFSSGIRNTKDALMQFSALQAEEKVPEQLKKYEKPFEQAKQFLANTAEVLPNIFGLQGKKTYLILFQNNMELRPGGGFIGSYGLVEIEKGKVSDIRIHDVYDADGQLKDDIPPPHQLQRYMNARHWFLRDSNFDVDFTKNAAQAANFLYLETGQKVDGVIAVDAMLLRNLIAAIGDIKVSGYNEVITADNFFLLTEHYAQDDFFPGSSQKKDFLNAVYTSILTRLSDAKHLPLFSLAEAVAKSAQQKNLLIAFQDTEIQRVFTLNGLSGSITSIKSGNEQSFYDFFGVNEANIGANKVNYYLDRSIRQDVNLKSDGTISERITINYKNKSKVGDKYGGDYKNYVRFILPKDAQVSNIMFDGKEQEIVSAVIDPVVFLGKNFITPQGLEVDRYEQEGKTIYGFFLNVPTGQEKEIVVRYNIQTPLSAALPSMNYTLHVFKQPGTGADPFIFSFTGPEKNKIISLNLPEKPGLKKTDKYVSILGQLSEDKEISIKLAKK